MTTLSWLIFLFVAGSIWGGFIFLLSLALRREAGKDAAAAE